jgi:two-component system chemotaxis response regulator CheB
MPIRVLIIDDSAFMRKALAVLLSSDASIEVLDAARNGEEGLKKIAELRPDVCTLDLEMPIMDGMTTLSKIRLLPENQRPAVLVCSTLTVAGSQMALKAMRLGASDVICKDPDAIGAGNEKIKKDIVARVKALAPSTRAAAIREAATKPNAPKPAAHFEWKNRAMHGAGIDLIVIGSSTGGPPILEQILGAIPADCPAPIVIAQHMPAMFTKSMSERLGEMCKIKVRHAEADCKLEKGAAYITMGGRHSRVHGIGMGGYRLEVSERPTDALYKPSVNELFHSASLCSKERCLGIMLTGMGDDGCIGARALHASGGLVLAQVAETCAVYGMPRAVVEAGITAAALTPTMLGQAVAQLAPSVRAAGRAAA